MTNIRNGVAVLESLWCDDRAWGDQYSFGDDLDNSTGYMTGNSPNQGTPRNLCFARPPATWSWGTIGSRKTPYEQMTPTYIVDGACYEMVAPGDSALGANAQLGVRGWNLTTNTVGGNSGYEAGGWAVGHAGYQTIRIKQDGDYLFVINIPFESITGGSTSSLPNPLVEGDGPNIVDLIRVQCEVYVNNALASNGTYGTDFVTGGGTFFSYTNLLVGFNERNRNKFWANAQYTTMLRLSAGDLVNIRVRGLNETYNGPNGTSIAGGAPYNTRRTAHDTARFFRPQGTQDRWGDHPAKVYIERLEDKAAGGPSVFSTTASRSITGGGGLDSNFHPDNEQFLSWDTPSLGANGRYDTESFTWSPANAQRITIDEAGWYQIHLHYRYGQLDDEVDLDLGSVARLYKNGGLMQVNGPAEVRPASATVLRRQKVDVYNSGGGGTPVSTRLDKVGTGNYTGVQYFAAGDYFEVSIQGEGTGYSTTDGKAEITLIKLESEGAFAKDTAIFHAGEPSSCLVDLDGRNNTSYPPVNKTTNAWNHQATTLSEADSAHYRVDTGWTAESVDPQTFEYLGGGRWRVKKTGFLLVSILHGAEVNTNGVSETDTTWDSGAGYGRAGASHLFDHFSSSILNVGVEPSGTWPNGTPKKIENTSLAFGVQGSLSHYASSRTNAGTMHRTKLFSSSFNGTGLSATDYGVGGTPVPIPAGTEISTWTRGFGQAESPLYTYFDFGAGGGGAAYKYYPGALEKEATDDTQEARLVLRLITPLVNANGDLSSGSATLDGSGSSQGQTQVSGGLLASGAVLDSETQRVVASTLAGLRAAPATVSGGVGGGQALVAGLEAQRATTQGGLSVVKETVDATLTPAGQPTLKGAGDRLVEVDENLPNTASFNTDIDRIVAPANGGAVSLVSGSATVTNSSEAVFAIAENLEAQRATTAGVLQHIQQSRGVGAIAPDAAGVSAEVLVGAGLAGALTPTAARVTSNNNFVYRQVEGSLTSALTTLAGAGTRGLFVSAELAAADATVASSGDVATELEIGLAAADATTEGQLVRTSQGVVELTTRIPVVSDDIDRIVDADPVSLGTGTPSFAAALDLIRESDNDLAVSLSALPASLSADLDKITPTLGASLSAGLGVLAGAGAKTVQTTELVNLRNGLLSSDGAGEVKGQITGALVTSTVTLVGDGDVYREGESAVLEAQLAALAGAGQVAKSFSSNLQGAAVSVAGAVVVKRQLSGALVLSIAQTQSDGQKIGVVSGSPASVSASLEVSASITSQGDCSLDGGTAHASGEGLRLAQGSGAFENAVAFAASPQLVSVGSAAFNALVSETQGEVEVYRESESAILQATPAAFYGSIGVVGGAYSVSLVSAAASLEANLQQAAQATPSLQAATAVVGGDLDLIRESDNDLAVSLTPGAAQLTTDVSVIRDAESIDLVAETALTAATITVVLNSVAPSELLAAAAKTDGFIAREADKALFGSLSAASAQVTSSLGLSRQVLSALLGADEATLSVSSTCLKQATVTLQAESAITAGSSQLKYGITGDLTPIAAVTTGSVQRYWEAQAALVAASVSLTAAIGAVQPPTATYNLIVPSSRYVVFVSLD